MTIDELLQRLDIGEDQETELESAAGGLPKSLWETISSFANTNGGYIILGAVERKNNIELTGISNPQAMIKSFWDTHNNPQKLNIPICAEADVQIMAVEGRRVAIIHIPRANRAQLPV